MKIIPEKVTPAKIQFTSFELDALRGFMLTQWNGEGTLERIQANIDARTRMGTYFLDNDKEDGVGIQVPFEHGGGWTIFPLSEFEEYCRKTGVFNGKQYDMNPPPKKNTEIPMAYNEEVERVDVEVKIILRGCRKNLVERLDEMIYENSLESIGDVDIFGAYEIDLVDERPNTYDPNEWV